MPSLAVAERGRNLRQDIVARKLHHQGRQQIGRLQEVFHIAVHEAVVPAWRVDEAIHYAGFPKAPRRGQQDMAEAELFPN